VTGAKDPVAAREVVNLGSAPGQCPSCGSVALVHQEGCAVCTACGYSKCG
jgi:ribonucleoside-diphosphate reductase alpha chain